MPFVLGNDPCFLFLCKSDSIINLLVEVSQEVKTRQCVFYVFDVNRFMVLLYLILN